MITKSKFLFKFRRCVDCCDHFHVVVDNSVEYFCRHFEFAWRSIDVSDDNVMSGFPEWCPIEDDGDDVC